MALKRKDYFPSPCHIPLHHLDRENTTPINQQEAGCIWKMKQNIVSDKSLKEICIAACYPYQLGL
jgi:hypothetical protein